MRKLYHLFLALSFFFFVNGETVDFFGFKGSEKKEEAVVNECPPYALLSPVRYCCEETPFYSSASFLYWQGKMGGLDFAAKNQLPLFPSNSAVQFKARIYTPDFDWQPGVKLVFGYTTPYDGWDVLARWTYYHGELTDAKRNFTSSLTPKGLGISPLWNFPFFQNTTFIQSLLFQNAHNDWGVIFNTFDLEWGRFFCINQWMKMRLHGGLKGGYLKQDYHVSYQAASQVAVSLNSLTGTDVIYLNSDFRSKNKFWGIGPRVGVDSRWKIACGFQLIADSSFSLVPSYFKVKEQVNDQVLDIGNTIAQPPLIPAVAKIKEEFLEFLPVFQVMLGFDWGMCVSEKTPLYFGITIGYEVQYWWDVNQTRRGIISESPGDLYNNHGDWQLQGLTASINFRY